MRKVYVVGERCFQQGHTLWHGEGTSGLAYLDMFDHGARLSMLIHQA